MLQAAQYFYPAITGAGNPATWLHTPALLEMDVMNEVRFGPRLEHTEEIKVSQVAAVSPSPGSRTSGTV